MSAMPSTCGCMGSDHTLRGKVESVAAGIEDRDRSAGATLLANVNPTFNWVRLAQRVPVRIALDRGRAQRTRCRSHRDCRGARIDTVWQRSKPARRLAAVCAPSSANRIGTFALVRLRLANYSPEIEPEFVFLEG